MIRESDLFPPSHRDDAVQVSSSVFSEAYKAPSFPPPPPPPRRASAPVVAPALDETDLPPDDYEGIDMLLAQSLSELNGITTFPSTATQGSSRREEEVVQATAPSPGREGEATEGRRKSLFGWGKGGK
jgi:hypothetical protein